jgi:predicted dehydrogenase
MKPRLGFLGVGWIGRNRLEAVSRSGLAEIVAVADAVPENAAAAAKLTAATTITESLEELLDRELDGIVIATPSALHAEQAVAAFERGVAVFCQKPLGRTGLESAAVVEAARRADRLLAVDLSYRFVEGARRIRDLVQQGELGSIYAVDVVFHNAYGPDKPWFYDPALSGGGCVIDLGTHLVDLALWMLEPAVVVRVCSQLFAQGKPLRNAADRVEDFALAQLELDRGTQVRLACSWNAAAGCDAIIQASLFGTHGGALLSNVAGSFYDFTADRFRGTARERLCEPPDEWGGRAILDWAARLARGTVRFDPEAERLVDTAAVLDAIYGRAEVPKRHSPAEPAFVMAEAGSP